MPKSETSLSQQKQEAVRRKMEEVRLLTLGPHTSFELEDDPKHLLFRLARYKFVAKLFANKGRVVEIGCGDGFGASLVVAEGNDVTGVDIESYGFDRAVDTLCTRNKLTFVQHDFTEEAMQEGAQFDAAFSLDVIEHLDPERELQFITNIANSCSPVAPLIIGAPNKDAERYASPQSKFQHINLHTQDTLRTLLERVYGNVFIFGMNDEVVHTGFAPMCHYIIAVATDRRR